MSATTEVSVKMDGIAILRAIITAVLGTDYWNVIAHQEICDQCLGAGMGGVAPYPQMNRMPGFEVIQYEKRDQIIL